jgi:ubiquinone/menaquinone biosynthesis C-methylase UbiE
MIDDIQEYYNQRARIYEEIYRRDDPVRQAELAAVAGYLAENLEDRRVLEIACGTGYWSERIARVVQHLTGIDRSAEMLEIAAAKALPVEKVHFVEGDAFALQEVDGEFDAALAVFWLSHLPKARIATFLEGMHRRIGPGARVVMADNMFNDGLGGEIIRPEGSEDTYKIRELPDGSRHQIVKNYYEEIDLREIFEPHGDDLEITIGRCYWWVSYLVGEDR